MGTDGEELGEKEREEGGRKGRRDGGSKRVNLKRRRGEVKDAGGGPGLGMWEKGEGRLGAAGHRWAFSGSDRVQRSMEQLSRLCKLYNR